VGVVRRAAGRFCAVRIGAAPTCAWIVNGARDVFLGLGAKVKKRKTISRRHFSGTIIRALLKRSSSK
jgi:hypothetical protein